MALERIYTIPLRKEFSRAPNYRRTKRSVRTIREFLQRHMKCDNVKLGKYLNLELWKDGRKNPPPRIQVKAIKDKIKIKDKDVEVVQAELINAPIEFKKEEKKAEAKEEKKKDKLEEEKKEVLEKGEKKETKLQREEEAKPKDVIKHQKVASEEVQEKMRSQKIITSPQKPRHEHHDAKGKK